MKWSFRRRLLIGHTLPILILVPVLGFALISLIENRLVFPFLANDMIDEGFLVTRITQGNEAIWISAPQAQALLDSIPPRPPTRIALLDKSSILLATNRPDDRSLVGRSIGSFPSNENTASQPSWAIDADDPSGSAVLAVLVPVSGPDGSLIGTVRVYRRIADIQQMFTVLRLMILGVLVVGLLMSSVTSFLLSSAFSRSLQYLTQIIADAPLEGKVPPLSEEGDEELRSLAQAYNRLQERRQELELARQQMLANIIHEMGRPLGSLRTAIHALQSGAMAEPDLRDELLIGMTERIVRMGRLIQDLSLTYRKLSPQELNIQVLQVKDWMDRLTPLWAENARESELEWQCVIDDDLPSFPTDPERLAQVLSNLVGNAIKYTSAGGKVTLIVCSDDDNVVFTVQDTGPGISVEDQTHLFTPFFRGGQTPWKAPGLGLGLSISRSIIESMDGEISLQNTTGQGSSFVVRLRRN